MKPKKVRVPKALPLSANLHQIVVESRSLFKDSEQMHLGENGVKSLVGRKQAESEFRFYRLFAVRK